MPLPFTVALFQLHAPCPIAFKAFVRKPIAAHRTRLLPPGTRVLSNNRRTQNVHRVTLVLLNQGGDQPPNPLHVHLLLLEGFSTENFIQQ